MVICGICFITLAPSFRYCMDKFGWNPEEGDGLMAAGGSMSNFYGMVRTSTSVFVIWSAETCEGAIFAPRNRTSPKFSPL